MLGEIIKELTTIRGNDTVTSENILSWMKRIEAQRAQAVVMSAITETKEFNKIKVARHALQRQLKRANAIQYAIEIDM